MSDSVVDWGLAGRLARGVSGGADVAAARALPLKPEALAATGAEAEGLVRAYSRLDPATPLPAPEAVDRSAWADTILFTLRELAGELEPEAGLELSLPGPLAEIARRLVAAAGAAEVGLAVGYASRRVLGQYDIALVGAERPPRLLFVAPNLAASAGQLGSDLEQFVRWVALHETTHAVQFAAAPWLRDHLGELIRRLLEGAMGGAGLGELSRRIASDPRGALSAFLKGDLAKAIAGPEQEPLLGRIQATMTVIEGHAEHVMDGAAGEFVADVEGLRARLKERRQSRGPIETVLARLLGLDLKLRQYELGKAFCDEVARREGLGALNRLWAGSEALPDLEELSDPPRWLARVRAAASV